MIPADLVELLRCPQSGQALTLAEPEVIARFNEQRSRASSAAGPMVRQPLTDALIRQDRLLLYPIRDGIPILLAEEGVPL